MALVLGDGPAGRRADQRIRCTWHHQTVLCGAGRATRLSSILEEAYIGLAVLFPSGCHFSGNLQPQPLVLKARSGGK